MIVVGMDPSLTNWGLARAHLNPATLEFSVNGLGLIKPHPTKSKQVRQNSKDLKSAEQLAEAAFRAAKEANVVFVEVPVGSQSARAMASYGVCIGVLGALRAWNVPFFEVTPTEVKLATVGKKTASKAEMISWAMQQHPKASWPLKGDKVIAGKAEHMADAIGAIQAGVHLPQFKSLLAMGGPHSQ